MVSSAIRRSLIPEQANAVGRSTEFDVVQIAHLRMPGLDLASRRSILLRSFSRPVAMAEWQPSSLPLPVAPGSSLLSALLFQTVSAGCAAYCQIWPTASYVESLIAEQITVPHDGVRARMSSLE